VHVVLHAVSQGLQLLPVCAGTSGGGGSAGGSAASGRAVSMVALAGAGLESRIRVRIARPTMITATIARPIAIAGNRLLDTVTGRA